MFACRVGHALLCRLMIDRFNAILEKRVQREDGTVIGRSRERRPVRAFRLGQGPVAVSLIGGCHADEPVGPRFLRHLAGYLGELPATDSLLTAYQWWIVPHVNPDGEARNRAWYGDDDETYDLPTYLSHVVRELPGDDIEFGFPRGADDHGARPENRALYDWWRSEKSVRLALHVTLHGMAFAAGPWFLIEPAWRDRCELFKARCREAVRRLGYALHDVERRGEKGFVRLERGFTTRPDSGAMRRFFMEAGDQATAQLFRPSSMETMRSLGGDPLTLVSEMPLFLTPGVGETLGPPDPVAVEWKGRLAEYRVRLGESPTAEALRSVRLEADAAGLRPMPVRDQMELQWVLIVAGLEQVEENTKSLPSMPEVSDRP